jgi:levanase/fructan beta-fructosidase
MYDKNPHMKFPERDPKVFWHEPSRHWVMMMYGQNQYHIFTSTNLLNWKNEGHPIPNSYECPDFFELPVDDSPAIKKWVLIQGNGKYSIGTFDGHEFKEETERFPCDVGPNFYATQTWGNVETGDGRRIQAAWMRGAVFPDMPFNQQISFPCELKLRGTTKGPRLFREPVHEIETLHNGKDEWSNRTLNARQSLPLEPDGECFHIIADVKIPNESKLVFNLRGAQVVLTSTSIESAGTTTPTLEPISRIEILLDRTSVEVFVNHGEISSTRYFLPNENGLSVRAQRGPVTMKQLNIYHLRSAWKD